MNDHRIPWKKLNDIYATENISYKEEAREVLSQRLGFIPDLRVSIDAELAIRRALKKFNDEVISKHQLDELIQIMSQTVYNLTKGKCIS